MSKSVDFYFDLTSPYAYLASKKIDGMCESAGAKAVWKPFFLGGVMQATGNKPPATLPAKGKYLFQDVNEWAEFYGVPLKFPSKFPLNSIKPMRACLAAEEQGKLREFASAMYDAYWGNGKIIDDPAVIGEIAGSVGLDVQKLFARIEEQEIKDKLKANTDTAVAAGAFGAPTMVVDGRMYWGNDRLPLLERYLKKA